MIQLFSKLIKIILMLIAKKHLFIQLIEYNNRTNLIIYDTENDSKEVRIVETPEPLIISLALLSFLMVIYFALVIAQILGFHW
ncbi:unnamed protein product [Blepharisma stoltei]|uniref:Uncharacterized protein n=1 Tax=Blepharisma stoltei TaxID=1481888 RepID=A0AAU9IJP1_9CILI|nr:unnamed protein product [Blepharisma stoltei]